MAGLTPRAWQVRHYLLEKARVVSQHPGERNYHVFYQMCAGLPEELRTRLHLAKPQSYSYLNKSGVYELLDTDGNPLCDEVAEFNRVVQSMSQMRIERDLQAQVRGPMRANGACTANVFNSSRTELAVARRGGGSRFAPLGAAAPQVWQVLAAILHLGNIEFETIDKKSEGEGSRVLNPEVLNRVADLIECDRQVPRAGGRGMARAWSDLFVLAAWKGRTLPLPLGLRP